MGFLITTSQSHLLGLSLGLAVLVFGVFQICEGLHIILYRWNSASIIAQYMIRIIAVINIVDGLTGVGAALLPSPSLAFTAAIGYIVDGLVHITQTTLRWVAVFEEYEAGLLPNKGSTWTFINLLWVLMSILVLALTWMFVRATFSYYQVLLVRFLLLRFTKNLTFPLWVSYVGRLEAVVGSI